MFRLIGSADSSMGESSTVLSPVIEQGVIDSPVVTMNASSRGKVWLRGRIEAVFMVVVVIQEEGGRSVVDGREHGRPINGEGAVPESGVKKGEVGLSGPGENVDDGAVSVKAVFMEVELAEWNGCRNPL
jgi:hypothetical protein